MTVTFYKTVPDEKCSFAVIVARSAGKWVFCKHKMRNTFEVPGGHRGDGETAEEAARRELYEETGAVHYDLYPLCGYSVLGKDAVIEEKEESFGMLFYAEIYEFEKELYSEIESVHLLDKLPQLSKWTYPLIQPKLVKRVIEADYVK